MGGANLVNLTYNRELELEAAKYARLCEFKHHEGNIRGENLYLGWVHGFKNVVDETRKAAEAWHSDKDHVDKGWHCIAHEDASQRICGHYSQQVWTDTRELGCAMTTDCGMFNSKWTMVYCEYWPPGNIMKYYDAKNKTWIPEVPFNETSTKQ